MSMAPSPVGRPPAMAVTANEMALITTPSTSARPGRLRRSHVRQTCHRDGISPGRRAMGRTGSLMWRVDATRESRRRALQLRAKMISEYG